MGLLGQHLRIATSIILLLCLAACAIAPHTTADKQQYVLSSATDTVLAQFAPNFIVDNADEDYNRIGTAALRIRDDDLQVYVDPNQATIYAAEQQFCANNQTFTNLIYRVHFSKTPYSHLTAGKNVGLIIIVTLNQAQQPLLVTTVHSCGCYLAFIPTSNLDTAAYPPNWPVDKQEVYGELLPSSIATPDYDPARDKLVLRLRSGTHRIRDIQLRAAAQLQQQTKSVSATIKPMAALRNLEYAGQQLSFFETEGSRKGYVRHSQKPFERLFMSWWAMDWRVGEDKDLGPSEQTGVVFYTSLKFWDWEESNLWNFDNFLNYWGWKL
ncbi:MAG: hypothetical protein RBR22_05860 [Desulfuromonas sp.]|nr:hypothetical protein [Desulfuromonas sp.]